MADAEDAVTEAMLACLRPRTAAVDPVAAAYAAGRAAGRRGLNGWRLGAVAAIVAAVGGRDWSVGSGAGERTPPGPVEAARLWRPVLPGSMVPGEVSRVEEALLDVGLDGLPPAPRRAVFPDAPARSW